MSRKITNRLVVILCIIICVWTLVVPLNGSNTAYAATYEPFDVAVLGDSIANGFGVGGYDRYSNKIYLGLYSVAEKRGYDFRIKNFGVDGLATQGLINKIDYMDPAYLETLDVVSISIGGNDLLHFLLLEACGALGIKYTDLDDAGNKLSNKFNKSNVFQKSIFAIKIADRINSDGFKSRLSKVIDDAIIRTQIIVAKIKDFAPNSQVFVQTLYNPLDNSKLLKLFSGVVSPYINTYNSKLKEQASLFGKYEIIDVYQAFKNDNSGKSLTGVPGDVSQIPIHPTVYGHNVIAWLYIPKIEPLIPCKYGVTYSFNSSSDNTKQLPQEVLELLPLSTDKNLTNGMQVIPEEPTKKEVAVEGGKWIFKGYTPESATINGADATFMGIWEFVETHRYDAICVFESTTPDKRIPEEVMSIKPEDVKGIADGSEIWFGNPEKNEITVADGKWIFKGYTPEKATINGADVIFKGLWEFVETPHVAYYDVIYTFESVIPEKVVPTEITELLPENEVDIENGVVVTPKNPRVTQYDVADGKWIFKGYTPENATINGADVIFKGLWEFVETHKHDATCTPVMSVVICNYLPTTVKPGGVTNFGAIVLGNEYNTENNSRGVSWTIEGAKSNQTNFFIVPEMNGFSEFAFLYVGPDETAEQLTVRATSKCDESKSASIVVTVVK